MPEAYEIATSAKGKRGELIVVGKLLERGYKVYSPMIDTGIDCLVDVGEGNYKEIQIKYREDDAIFEARKFKPRDSFYFICYLSTRHGDDLWVIPSRIFLEKGKARTMRGHEYVELRIGREGSETYEGLRQFHDNFYELLKGASNEVVRVVRKASKRIEEEHFKEQDYVSHVLEILSKEATPMRRGEIVRRVGERLQGKFSKADLEVLTGNTTRWEKTVRFAISHMNREGMIEAQTKNQWAISKKGREFLAKVTGTLGG